MTISAEHVERFVKSPLWEQFSAEPANPTSDPHGEPVPGDEARCTPASGALRETGSRRC